MRLLIYSYEFPPTRGGAGTYSYELASALQSLGHEIQVVALRQTTADDSFDRQCGLKVHRMELWQGAPPFNHHYLMKVFWSFRFEIVLVADRGAQGAVAHMPVPFFPYCVTVHGSEVWAYFHPQKSRESSLNRDLYYKMFSQAKGIIAVSNATAQLLASYVPDVRDRLHVVLNGIKVERHTKPSLEVTQNLRETLGLQGRQIAFCLSRINIDKGHDVLVRAFASVVKQVPEATLLIGGHGPYLRHEAYR